MVAAVQHSTDGIFCESPVVVGMAVEGLFCGEIYIPPVIPGGGGSGPGIGLPGQNYFNQAPPRQRKKTDEPLFLDQALQEDEEFLIMLSAIMKVIN